MNFAQREEEERKIILKWVNQEKDILLNTITKVGSYESYDASIVSGDSYQKYLVEVKIREFPHDRYDTSILEESKINRIKTITDNIKSKKGIDIKIIYLAKYTDNIILIWDVDNYEQIVEKECPVTSTGVDKGMITKRLMEYNINKSQKIKLK